MKERRRLFAPRDPTLAADGRGKGIITSESRLWIDAVLLDGVA
jgi:hypothetical protein